MKIELEPEKATWGRLSSNVFSSFYKGVDRKREQVRFRQEARASKRVETTNGLHKSTRLVRKRSPYRCGQPR